MQTEEEAGKIWGQEASGRDLGHQKRTVSHRVGVTGTNQICREDPGWEGGAYKDHSNPGWGGLST